MQKLISTKGQMKDFIDYSPVWKDISSELNVWLEEIRNQLENNDGNMSSRILDRLGGNAESVRNLLNLPLVLLETLENENLTMFKN